MHDTLEEPPGGYVSDNGKQPRGSQPAASSDELEHPRRTESHEERDATSRGNSKAGYAVRVAQVNPVHLLREAVSFAHAADRSCWQVISYWRGAGDPFPSATPPWSPPIICGK